MRDLLAVLFYLATDLGERIMNGFPQIVPFLASRQVRPWQADGDRDSIERARPVAIDNNPEEQ